MRVETEILWRNVFLCVTVESKPSGLETDICGYVPSMLVMGFQFTLACYRYVIGGLFYSLTRMS